MQIQPDRLWDALSSLGEVGAYDDARSGLRGVNRLALTDADAAGRRHVIDAMRALNLSITIDQIGNVYGRRAGREPDLAPVMMGSHIDSVPTGGRFDGCLGVLGGLEILATLDDHGVLTRRPLEVAFFTDEEGCRFGTDMLGSAVATGRLDLEHVYGLRDHQGLTVRDELERIGFLGEVDPVRAPPHAYIETHIEQGPVLAAAGAQIGVVTGVQGISWSELTIYGMSSHAGTTPTPMRRDAGLVAARINLAMRAMATSGRFGQLRATMGCIQPYPGLVNIVPGRVLATVDLRNPLEALLVMAEEALRETIAEIAAEERVEVSARQTARTPPVDFDPRLVAAVAASAEAQGLRHMEIVSGAGHDAQEWARRCPTAMVFVPGERDGISHNPREFSTAEACANGVNTALAVVLELAEG